MKLHQLQVRACIVQTTSNVEETPRVFSRLLDAEVSGMPKSWYIALGNEPSGAKGSRNICAFASGVAGVPKDVVNRNKKTCPWCAPKQIIAPVSQIYVPSGVGNSKGNTCSVLGVVQNTHTFTTRDVRIGPPDGFSKTRQFSGIVATSGGAKKTPDVVDRK